MVPNYVIYDGQVDLEVYNASKELVFNHVVRDVVTKNFYLFSNVVK